MTSLSNHSHSTDVYAQGFKGQSVKLLPYTNIFSDMTTL